MATWHQEQAARRAYEAGTPLRYDHPTKWTVRTSAPNRMASGMLYDTREDAERYLANLERLAAENPDDVERRLTAKHSYILPPRAKENDHANATP